MKSGVEFKRSSKIKSKDSKIIQYSSKHISIVMEVPNKHLNNHMILKKKKAQSTKMKITYLMGDAL